MAEEQRLVIRDGTLTGVDESWVYVWMRSGQVAYIGAARLPPLTRTWLHLNHDDPEVGWIRARRPDLLEGEISVRAFRLHPELDREDVRQALFTLFKAAERTSPSDDDDPAWAAAAEIKRRIDV